MTDTSSLYKSLLESSVEKELSKHHTEIFHHLHFDRLNTLTEYSLVYWY